MLEWNWCMTWTDSSLSNHLNKIPDRSFQYSSLSITQNFTDLSLRAHAWFRVSPGGTSNFCRKWIIPEYHSHEDNFSATGWLSFCSWIASAAIYVCRLADVIQMKFIPKRSQFSLAMSLARPFPFTILVGFTSMSNSIILAIHLALFPSMSSWVNTSFTTAEGT